jgi:heme exporter protein A
MTGLAVVCRRVMHIYRSEGGDVVALSGVDLDIAAGQMVALVGPSGSGKSTLIALLAGLMRPSAGEVRVLGTRLGRGADEARRAIGLLSHQSLLYDDLTLLENLTFTARLYGLPRPRETALAALAAAGLSERAGESPRRLSRGLGQRAAIARAMLHSPRLLLLDEPFTALDAASADRLRDELRRRLAEGLGLVIVTHHLAEVWQIATRVAVLVAGRWTTDEPRDGALESFLPRYHGLVGA